jgi:hypothetical protein
MSQARFKDWFLRARQMNISAAGLHVPGQCILGEVWSLRAYTAYVSVAETG